MKRMRKYIAFRNIACLALGILWFSGCGMTMPKTEETEIRLSDNQITVNGEEISKDRTQGVYAANDIVFYLAGQGFTYGEGTKEDEHEQQEADAHTVVHITQPGKYVLCGKLSLGQIAVDLGEGAETNPDAVVTLVLKNADITCTVAPAVIFYNVYECCASDEESATKEVDTSKAGANVIIADGTENNISGSYVAKIYKSFELNDDGTEVVDSKKLHKYDGAFYSKRTMNLGGGTRGDGVLNIVAENEGIGSELHLTIHGGTINVTSGNDGINTNKDNVSVTTILGGTLRILCDGSTGEGDGIDSNGWLVIRGGTVTAQACATSGDAGIDSDKGIYIDGGHVMASGNMLDRIAGGEQTYAVFRFENRQKGESTYTLKNSVGEDIFECAPANDFTVLVVSGQGLTPGAYTFWQGNTQLAVAEAGNTQNGMPPRERPGKPEGAPLELPEGMERPEKPLAERPPMPNDAFLREERPEMPEGMENRMPSSPAAGVPSAGEALTVFTIQEGGNQFIYVRAPEASE